MALHRKLVAVVMADVVGYSRPMERDEAGTHARLRELREQLVDPKIAEHGGRIVNTSGDGMLLEFPSATSALRCAVEIQREMERRNGKTGPYMEVVTCQARLALGAYDVAIPACERGMVSNDTWIVHATLAAAYALSGDTGKAAEARAKLLKLVPGFTVARYEARRVNPTPEGIAMDQRYLIPGLRKAGVPD